MISRQNPREPLSGNNIDIGESVEIQLFSEAGVMIYLNLMGINPTLFLDSGSPKEKE